MPGPEKSLLYNPYAELNQGAVREDRGYTTASNDTDEELRLKKLKAKQERDAFLAKDTGLIEESSLDPRSKNADDPSGQSKYTTIGNVAGAAAPLAAAIPVAGPVISGALKVGSMFAKKKGASEEAADASANVS